MFELKTNILTHIQPSLNIVVFTETWLQDGFLNSEFELHKFDIRRQIRTIQNNPSAGGGGVMISTKKQLKAVSILLDNCSHREMCIVCISFEHGNVVVVAAYIPPVSNSLSSGALIVEFDFFCTCVNYIQ